MEGKTAENSSPPEALKQIHLCGMDAEGQMVFGVKSTPKPASNDDLSKKGNEDGKEMLQSDIDKKMMPPPPAPSTSSPSSASGSVRCASTNLPVGEGEAPKKPSRMKPVELSKDSNAHNATCPYMMWVNGRKSLMTEEEVRCAFIETVVKIKNRKKREIALQKVPEALDPEGFVMEYLKSQREYYDSLKPQLADQCKCSEKSSDSTA